MRSNFIKFRSNLCNNTLTSLFGILVTISLLNLAVPLSTLAFPVAARNKERNETVGGSSKEFRLGIVDYSCYDDNRRPYTDLLPHPYDCNLFLQCIQVREDFLAIQRPCATEILEFSMKTCRCEFPNTPDAECFDIDNPEHQKNRMKCAKPVP